MNKEKKEYGFELGPAASKFDKVYFGSLSRGYTLEEIEKALNVVEVLKINPKIHIDFVQKMPTYEDYCDFAYDFMMIPREAYDLLREVFCDVAQY